MMSLVIDDFETGFHSFLLPLDSSTATDDTTQDGERIIGALRRTVLIVNTNPLRQVAQLTVGAGSLVLSTGVGVFHQLQIGYGNRAAIDKPLGRIKLAEHGDRLRFCFNFSNLPLNFNVEIVTGNTVSSTGVNLDIPNVVPFFHDFMLSDFVGEADVDAADGILLLFQNGIAGQDYELSRIEVTNAV